jgi:hypothetical protein
MTNYHRRIEKPFVGTVVLPTDIVAKILWSLSFSEVVKFRRTCRQWEMAARRVRVKLTVWSKGNLSDDLQLRFLLELFPNASHVRVDFSTYDFKFPAWSDHVWNFIAEKHIELNPGDFVFLGRVTRGLVYKLTQWLGEGNETLLQQLLKTLEPYKFVYEDYY